MPSARNIAFGLLLFLGSGALLGAIPMIVHPFDDQFGLMPLSLLRYSPFHSYLIPGIILLAANGLLSFWVLWRVAARKPHCGLWTAFQGCVLLGWLAVECWMLRAVMWAHSLYAAVALALIVCGLLLRRDSRSAATAQG